MDIFLKILGIPHNFNIKKSSILLNTIFKVSWSPKLCVYHIYIRVLVYVLLYLTSISYKSLSLNFWKSKNLSLESWGRLEELKLSSKLCRGSGQFPNQQQRLEVELVGLETYRVFLEKKLESLNMVLSLQVIHTALTGVFLLEFHSHHQCWQTQKAAPRSRICTG